MRVYELNEDQLTQLKQSYYCERNQDASYLDLATINDYISDAEIIEYYYDVNFVEEDFT